MDGDEVSLQARMLKFREECLSSSKKQKRGLGNYLGGYVSSVRSN